MARHRWFIAALVLIATTVNVGGQPPPPAAATTRPGLSGEWLLASTTLGLRRLMPTKLTIAGDRYTLSGYWGRPENFTGRLAVGVGGEERAVDLHTDAYTFGGVNQGVSYAACTLPALYQVDGDQLTVSFATGADARRPADFTPGPGRWVETFVRAEPGLAYPPTDVTVTVLGPDGKPVAGAGLFDYMGYGYAHAFDPKQPLGWGYGVLSKTGPDGTMRVPWAEFIDAPGGTPGVRCNAVDPTHRWIGFADASPAAVRHGTLTIRLQRPRAVRGTIASAPQIVGGQPMPPPRYLSIRQNGQERAQGLYPDGVCSTCRCRRGRTSSRLAGTTRRPSGRPSPSRPATGRSRCRRSRSNRPRVCS